MIQELKIYSMKMSRFICLLKIIYPDGLAHRPGDSLPCEGGWEPKGLSHYKSGPPGWTGESTDAPDRAHAHTGLHTQEHTPHTRGPGGTRRRAFKEETLGPAPRGFVGQLTVLARPRDTPPAPAPGPAHLASSGSSFFSWKWPISLRSKAIQLCR